jgi:curli biogenesis system outer membrane secretion channel CsgG
MTAAKSHLLRIAAPLFLIATVLVSGCETLVPDRSYRYVHPTVAVFKFENKAGSPMKWDLGTGMADVMVTGLMDTERFTVVEREDLNAILKELDLQNRGRTRPEGKVPSQRLINVQYLIKGTVTDFSHISRGGIRVSTSSTGVRGRAATALVSMVITVIDVESGEILVSTTKSSRVRARGIDLNAAYEGISFGGQAFYRTPLGRATRSAIDDAIEEVVDTIGSQPWRPAIIDIDDDRVVLNGGRDRRVKPGHLYQVMQPGERIFDTETGNYLGTTPGEGIGLVEVTEVYNKFSYAVCREGETGEVGFRLHKLSSKERKALSE